MERNISVIKDVNGKQLVVINDICFKGRQNIDWNEAEQYLKQYVGEFVEIAESKEIIYIGNDFHDSVSRKALYLTQDVLRLPAALPPAYIRHNAVAAKIITSKHNIHTGFKRIFAL